MAEAPPGGLDVALEVGRIASLPGPAEDRATQLLPLLRRLIPFRAGALALLDPVGVVTPLATTGYDDATVELMASAAFAHDVQEVWRCPDRPPRCSRDLPVRRDEPRIWAAHLGPAGSRDGLGALLVTPAGALVGLLLLHTDSPWPPTDAARDLLGQLAPTIATAIDPLRQITALARLVTDARAGGGVTPEGHIRPVPGLAWHPLLYTECDALADVAATLIDEVALFSFLCPDPDGIDGHVRVTALACPAQPHLYVHALLLISPPGDLHGLTRRELEILGLLVDGWVNRGIARSLYITERTVAAHVEHILAKLAVPSRTLAAVRAQRYGLFVPRRLNSARDRLLARRPA